MAQEGVKTSQEEVAALQWTFVTVWFENDT